MIKPSPGLLCFHDGRPIEFLYAIRSVGENTEWLVRPIFVDDPVNRIVLVRPGDTISPVHTKFT